MCVVALGGTVAYNTRYLGKRIVRESVEQMECVEPLELSEEASEEAETPITILAARVSLPISG